MKAKVLVVIGIVLVSMGLAQLGAVFSEPTAVFEEFVIESIDSEGIVGKSLVDSEGRLYVQPSDIDGPVEVGDVITAQYVEEVGYEELRFISAAKN